MTTEEIKKELHELYPNINGFIDHTLVAEMCLKWHELQLKKCNMPDVSGSFSAEDMEEAYNDGAGINKPREFDINNYR